MSVFFRNMFHHIPLCILYALGYKLNVSVIILDDHCRVVLSGDETEDYINASYIDVIARLILHSPEFS